MGETVRASGDAAGIGPDAWTDAYENAVLQAEAAARAGTFGVGGRLMGPFGETLAVARNRVLEGGRLWDPTAHVERQLIDRLFAEKHAGKGPRGPEAATIVSSLEPCMMCAGAILIAGVNCVAIAEDPFAGVGVLRGFPALPPTLRTVARQRFSMPAVEGGRAGTPPAYGSLLPLPLPRETERRSRTIFQESLRRVREAVHTVSSVRDSETPGFLEADTTASIDVPAIRSRVWSESISGGARRPKPLEVLEEVGGGDGSKRQAACLVDESGALVCAAGEATDLSPIRTAVLELIRLFALDAAGRHRRKASRLTLLVTMPFRSDEEIICSLGAVGSFLEGPIGARSLPYVQLVGATPQDIDHVHGLLARFPPFYTEYVGLSVGAASLRPTPS